MSNRASGNCFPVPQASFESLACTSAARKLGQQASSVFSHSNAKWTLPVREKNAIKYITVSIPGRGKGTSFVPYLVLHSCLGNHALSNFTFI